MSADVQTETDVMPDTDATDEWKNSWISQLCVNCLL